MIIGCSIDTSDLTSSVEYPVDEYVDDVKNLENVKAYAIKAIVIEVRAKGKAGLKKGNIEASQKAMLNHVLGCGRIRHASVAEILIKAPEPEFLAEMKRRGYEIKDDQVIKVIKAADKK